MRGQFKQNFIIALIGSIGMIVGASITILPQLLKSDTNEIIVKIAEIKQEQYKIRTALKPEFKVGTKEDAYFAAIIDCLSRFSEISQGVKISSQYDKSESVILNAIRTSTNYEFSTNLFIRKVANVRDAILLGLDIFLNISKEKDNKIVNEVVHVKNLVLQNRLKDFTFFEIEHFINKAGAYIVDSEFNEQKDGSGLVKITIKFSAKNIVTKGYIDISGSGIYYTSQFSRNN